MNEEEKNLMQQLIKQQKRTKWSGYIAAIACVLMVDNTDAVEEALKGVNSAIENVNKVIDENADSVNDALTNFNDIDFDSLNKAIRDLSSVIEPLANFANMFKR